MHETIISLKQRVVFGLTALVMLVFCVPSDFVLVDSEETQNEALTILLNATNLLKKVPSEIGLSVDDTEVSTIQSGDTVHFEVESALSDANTRNSVNVTIKVQAVDCEIFFDQFREVANGDGTSKVLDFQSSDESSKGVRLTLYEMEDNTYEIRYTIEQGQSVNGFLEYTTKEGTTANNSSTIITVSYDGEKNQNDRVSINSSETDTITIYNQSKVNWDSIKKGADTDEVKLSKNKDGTYSLNKDITYTVTANQKSLDSTSGLLYTKQTIVTDTLTLPKGLSFIDKNVTVSAKDGKIIVGNTPPDFRNNFQPNSRG